MGPNKSGFLLCSNSSIDGIKIFNNRKDREDFLERLADICKADALVRMWRALLL